MNAKKILALLLGAMLLLSLQPAAQRTITRQRK